MNWSTIHKVGQQISAYLLLISTKLIFLYLCCCHTDKYLMVVIVKI